MDKAKKNYDSKLTSLQAEVNNGKAELAKDNPDKEVVQQLLLVTERLLQRFLTVGDSLLDLMLKDASAIDIGAKEKEISDLFGAGNLIVGKMKDFLSEKPKERDPDHDDSASSVGKDKTHRLPKLELPKFTGEARDWLPFWSGFENVHNDANISPATKFQYLVSCMVKGSQAEELVNSYPLTAANYPQVVKSLKERYGREDMLVEVYVRDLISMILENVNSKATNLASLYHRLSTKLRALASLKVTSDKCATILYPMVESTLPEETLLAWERTRHQFMNESTEKILDRLMAFLKQEVEGSERIRLARQPFSQNSSNKVEKTKSHTAPNRQSVPTATSLVAASVAKPNNGCVFCEGKHESDHCARGMNLTLEERPKMVREKKRCFRCLKAGHQANGCKEVVKCVSCGQKHRAIMCPVLSSNKSETGKKGSDANQEKSVNMVNCLVSPHVRLQTILIKIVGKRRTKIVRALLDSASERSYVLKKTAAEVGLDRIGKKDVVHVLFGNVKSSPQRHSVYQALLASIDSSFECSLQIEDSNGICGTIPEDKDARWRQELQEKGIKLHEANLGETKDIEMLLGSDIYGKLLTGNKVDLDSGLTALETVFGWTVTGKMSQDTTDSARTVMSYDVMDASIQDLWNLDVIGITDPMKEKNKDELAAAALIHFKENVTRNEDGRYKVKLPWIEGHPPIPSYKFIAEKKLVSTTSNLKKREVLQAYHEVFEGWEKDGVIERVPPGQGHYLSHHGVLKPESTTTPVRPVFNASFKTKGNPSLNDCLEIGPNMFEEIPTIVTRFRLGPIGVTSDIKKAFLQIEVAECDRDYLRFVWYKDESFQEIQEFRHCRVVFGVSSSPFLLAATLDWHLSNCDSNAKDIAEFLKKSLYVDNCVASLSSMEEALKFKEVSTKLLQDAQMDLRCWEIGPSEENKNVPVLGLTWNLKGDTLAVDLRGPTKKLKDGTSTRRKILSVSHSVFDPIGLTCPFTIVPKILLQKSHKLKVTWDTALPEEIDKQFVSWCQELPDVSQLQIPRCAPANQNKETWSLIVVTDASSSAYAACVYLRSGIPGNRQVQLLMARARVAPIKDTTIPRLELVGCLCGARLATKVREMMNVSDIPISYWTDFTTALAWIRKNENWSVFVTNRVAEIHKLSKVEQWRHVPGKLNPADIPSRGASVKFLLESSWWEGAAWMKLEEDQWPKEPVNENEEEIFAEKRKQVICHVNVEGSHILGKLETFSDFHKIVRVVAYLRRFLVWIKKKSVPATERNKLKGPLSFKELDKAELRLLQLIQEKHFSGALGPKLKCLHTFKDEEGTLRVKTRLFPGEGEGEYTSQIVLPNKEPIVERLIWKSHVLECHVGVQLLHTHLRQRYWIIRSRRTIRSVIKPCGKCQRFRAKPVTVPEGVLPRDRVRVGPAFDVTGVDLAGPLYTKGNKKVWIVLFTCATYRGIHLELCSSLTTDSFVGALRRFVARRGRPSIVYSDNGLNFVGCANFLKRLDWNKILEYANVQRINWKFNPPTASWWGGFWERLIGVVKQLLRSVLGSSRAT